MHPTARHPVSLVAILTVAVSAALVPVRASASGAGLGDSLERFRTSASTLRRTDTEVRASRADLLGAYVEMIDAKARLTDVRDRIEAERSSLAAVGVVAYVRLGNRSDSSSAATTRVLASRTARMRSLREEEDAVLADLNRAERHRDHAASALSAVVARRSDQVEGVRRSGEALEAALRDKGVLRLSAGTYVAALDATSRIAEESPGCHLQAAVVAGFGQISGASNDDRIDDAGQPVSEVGVDGALVDTGYDDPDALGPLALPPSVWDRHGGDLDDDGIVSPLSLNDASLALGRALCSTGADLRSLGSLRSAVGRLTGERGRTNAVVGAARRLARPPDTGLGTLPRDVGAAGSALAPVAPSGGTTVEDLLAWSRAQLGTPYSQCLGDERPEDPPCPEGTNRFGAGFFDCSGFVSAAYASIGIVIPTTTDAMESDPDFMAASVSTTIDPDAFRPGDVILLEGHVALWSGDGMVIHANGVELVEERMPRWFRNGVVAVLRPRPS